VSGNAGDALAQRAPQWRPLTGSDTGRAVGMATAQMATNAIALVFTVVFARLLGASGYGSLAALTSAFIILMVPGSALQIAVAREVSQAAAGGSPAAGAEVHHWLERLVLATCVVSVVAVLLRDLTAAVINVDQVWAAAAVPVCGMLWMLVSVERGALQGFFSYRIVGLSIVAEAAARLLFALALVGLGLDVTGAFLGNLLGLVAVAATLAICLRPLLPARAVSADLSRLRDLLLQARIPVLGLTLLFALQEVHIIVVKHEASSDAAGSYAVAAVAAKALIWVAVGLGLYLVPEVARRAEKGTEARPVLIRTLGLIVLCSVPALLIFALGGEPLLAAVFGEDLTEAAGALPWLGLAMAFLACTYLAVQYLLALRRSSFVAVLMSAVVVEIALLAGIGSQLEQLALALFALQLACAATVLTLAFSTQLERARDQKQARAG
jgi:O-antigen/teichoic acid export membrane protein